MWAPDNWARVKEVFAGARALPADQRPAYLAEACGGNDALREEVESLLSSDERMKKSFLEAPAVVRGDETRVTRSLEGQRIGPYQLASRIGAGGMGEVYQARDTTLNRLVAIKVLLPAIANDPDRLARFRREAQVLASLNHPHIAQIHGFEDADGVHALVMELVEGPTLADRIVSGAIPINEALAIASQIADALEAAHEQGISPALGGAPRTFVEGGLEPIWSPDGRNVVYHTNDLGDPIFIADRNGSNPRQIFVAPPGVHGHYLTWSPDGRFIYFVRGIQQTEEMDIWRIPVSQSEAAATPERITSHNARVAYPAWLDARTLIYSATAEDGSGQWLYALDVEHRIPHRVSSGIAEQYLSVSVSQARPRRVVATIATPTASLWTVPISDRVQTEAAATRVLAPNTRALGPRFAPGDPAFLVFLSSKGGADGLWKLENGAPLELWRGDDGGVVAPPAISPDGRQICFSYRTQGTAGLYVMNANGTNVRTLAADSFDVRGAASWSPDGKWVAVAANRGQGTRLFKIPVDGGPPVRLLDTLSFNPVWSPDGRFIVYSEQQGAGQFEVKAITPDQAPVPIVELQIVGFTTFVPYRFLPDGKGLIVLEGVQGTSQNFFRVELTSGHRRQLTDLTAGPVIRNFDVSPDGTQIVFDRLRSNTDIVSMTLAR